MKIKAFIPACIGLLMLGAGAASAGEVRIHPYATHDNYCPVGLQPVVVGGVICCGTPNSHISYQAMKQHPVVRHKPRRAKRVVRVYDEDPKSAYWQQN